MMQDLARREMNEIHVEAGRGLMGALLQAGLVDDMLLYIAPKLLGPGMELAHLPLFPHWMTRFRCNFSRSNVSVRICASSLAC